MILSLLTQLLGFIGSLCILLFGMDMLSDGIQKGAGRSLQKLVAKLTGNRFRAVLTGLTVTAIIQSSGATTVMAVSFVNAELLTLEQAIGIIFGANIGTTMTAWIVSLFGFSFSISSIAIPLFGFGFILKYFKKLKLHNFADCFMGFALLFMGLSLLKDSLTLDSAASKIFVAIDSFGLWGILIGVAIGAFLTALIHSSSAMTAIILTMAANGTISWTLSAAIVLGSNIGSTIDAVMSSFGASVNARRTALVHVGFNVSGSILALIFFVPFLSLIDFIVPGLPTENITTHIAMLHTVFNLFATILFLPFVNQIAAISRRLIKETETEKDVQYKFPAILPKSHISTDLYLLQINKEISRMAAKNMEMFDSIGNSFLKTDTVEEETEKVQRIENYIDEMNHAITAFLQKSSRMPNANQSDREYFSKLINTTFALENLSDECCSLMHTVKKYLLKGDFGETQQQRIKELADYLEKVRIFFEMATIYFTIGITENEKNFAKEFEEKIDAQKKAMKSESRKRLETGADVKTELQFIDIVRKIERAGDCIWNIIQNI